MRPTCLRCLRPSPFCVCALLSPIPTRTRIVVLQHPRESRLAICTARLARLALPNSEMHRGVRFTDHPRVREIASTPGSTLLFPGPGALPVESLAGCPPPILVVLDGTWQQAERMLRDHPILAGLRRVAVTPDGPGGYGDLRREPAPGCLSTIEAVACALGAWEGERARYEPMRQAFRLMVAQQLACARGKGRAPRHRRHRSPGRDPNANPDG